VAIHESAVVDPSAKIHKNSEICAYTVIGANVEIGLPTSDLNAKIPVACAIASMIRTPGIIG
jgi:acyl-[acyl carrier protein]--UDP-N-acetylglucosamine O-acyltransferase